MDEHAARRVLLARAIEAPDGAGALLGPQERDQVDIQSRQDALQHADGRASLAPEEFVVLRARRVLAHVAMHHPQLAALQEPRPWQGWLEWLVPLVAVVLGVGTDAIGNPHCVDLVSLPLLGIVAWNIAMYLALLASAVWPRGARRRPWLERLGRWSDGALTPRMREGDAATQATVRFHLDWFAATRALHVARIKRVLHLSAAAWAMGVILSLVVRGLVVEYRVGWESTFLGPEQVYEILRVLRVPALLVYPFDMFSVADVARLRFSDGGGAAFGAPWVWMYVALLVSAVILPRLLLATWAAWREGRLARSLPLDLGEPYFARVIAMLESTRMQLGLLAHRPEDRERFLRVVAPDPATLPVLVSSVVGDVMRLVDLDPAAPPPGPPPPGSSAWYERLRLAFGRKSARSLPRDECDVVVHLVSGPGDAARAAPLLDALGKPVVTIQMGEEGEGLRLGAFGRTWAGDQVLLQAIRAALPQERRAGFDNILRAWDSRNEERLQRSMAAVADHALRAAREVEEIHAGPLSVRSLLPAERDTQAHARQAAMERIVQRIDASGQGMAAHLRRIHGVDDTAASAIDHRLEERFVLQRPVDAPQAGMAGAATGAAMGASVDLLAGGLTLGAAAALGAVVGGGAAFIAAAWKNRASPAGATVIQLSDDMLDALVEAALLRYVAIVHWARGVQAVEEGWAREVVARVQAQKPLLAGYWNTARTQPNPERLVQPLASELAPLAKTVLMHINS
jgi:hypothetical protein